MAAPEGTPPRRLVEEGRHARGRDLRRRGEAARRPRDRSRRAERTPRGHPGRQEPRARRRRPLEALAPEGHGPRSRGHDPLADLHRRRRHLRGQHELRRQGQPQGAPLGAPRRALEPCRQPARSASCPRTRSTRRRRRLRRRSSRDWGQESPLLVVAGEDEELLIKSFRNLPRVLVTVPSELEVASVVWARSVLITEAALPLVEGRAS